MIVNLKWLLKSESDWNRRLNLESEFDLTTTIQFSRGRLVQWESVRLPIQRSGFASRCFLLAAYAFYARPRFIGNKQHAIYWRRKAVFNSLSVWKGTQPEQIGPMTSYSLLCDVILLYLRNSTTHDPATCLSNKLTYLIYDGVEKLIVTGQERWKRRFLSYQQD